MKNICVLIFLLLSLYSCREQTEVQEVTQSEIDFYNQVLIHPVKVQQLEVSDMHYLVLSGVYGEAGVEVINVTLDSLKVVYYNRELNKQE